MSFLHPLLQPLLKKAPSKTGLHSSDYTVHSRMPLERGGQKIYSSGNELTNPCMEIGSAPWQPTMLGHEPSLTISKITYHKLVASISELRAQMILGSDMAKQMDLLHEIEKSLNDENNK